MSDPLKASHSAHATEAPEVGLGGRMTVPEIARRLKIGRLAVYSMLERHIIHGIRLGRRWIITRHAFEQWERTCGSDEGTGFPAPPEVHVGFK